MEKDVAVEMFTNSIDRRKLKYIEYVGDGDTNSFGAVVQAVSEKYGDNYKTEKQDCIGHIQKRMGNALRNYKSDCRGTPLSDGKTVGWARRSTDMRVDQIQTYYGYAIRNNKGIDNISHAIWAIYFHSIVGPSNETLEKQHEYCPDGPETWCKYKHDKMHGTNMYDRGKCLPPVFRSELRHIFERLS